MHTCAHAHAHCHSIGRWGWLQSHVPSTMSDDAELRGRLTELGLDVGPIDERTRAVYQRWLVKQEERQRERAFASEVPSVTGLAPRRSTRPERPPPPAASSTPGQLILMLILMLILVALLAVLILRLII